MSILDHGTASLNDLSIGQATLHETKLFRVDENPFRARIASLFPRLKNNTDTAFADGFANRDSNSMGAGISTLMGQTQRVTDSGYGASGQWALQLGEADIPNQASRLFLNVIDPFGAIVLQVHGIATDRNFGDVQIHGGDWDHQLRVYAFAGDFFGDVPRYLHRPFAVGDQMNMQVLLASLAEAADTISDANIDFMPTTLDSACDAVADAQNENSVIRSLLSVVSAQYPDFPIHVTVGWREPTGFMRDLGQAVARPFGDVDEQPGLPSAPKGRVPSFSARHLGAWFHGLREHEYRTVVDPAVQNFTE